MKEFFGKMERKNRDVAQKRTIFRKYYLWVKSTFWCRTYFEVIVMNPNLPSEKRLFAAAYLRHMDAREAAQSVGRTDGVRLLGTPAVQAELRLQRQQGEVCRADIVRRLTQLAFGRANDCVKLVLEEHPALDALELSLLSEVKRNDKGTVEVKLHDPIRALEKLMELEQQRGDCADAFFAAAEDGEAL